jgi:hypothetical protein
MTLVEQGLHAFDAVVHFKPTLRACIAVGLGLGAVLGLVTAFMM